MVVVVVMTGMVMVTVAIMVVVELVVACVPVIVFVMVMVVVVGFVYDTVGGYGGDSGSLGGSDDGRGLTDSINATWVFDNVFASVPYPRPMKSFTICSLVSHIVFLCQ